MLWLVRLPLMLLCAEWLLLFRAWMSPFVLLLLATIALLRQAASILLPSWDLMPLLLRITVFAPLLHVMFILRGRSRTERDGYGLPSTGAPWLLKCTNSAKRTFPIEAVISTAAVLFFSFDGSLIISQGFHDLFPQWVSWLHQNSTYVATQYVIPQGLRLLPTEWVTWLRQNSASIATQYGFPSVIALLLWELIHTPRKSPWLTPVSGYQAIREHTHDTPPLPSVKELAAEYKELYE